MTSISSSPVSDLRERVHRQLETLCATGGALAVGTALDSAGLTPSTEMERSGRSNGRGSRAALERYRTVPPGGHATGRCALATAGPPAAGRDVSSRDGPRRYGRVATHRRRRVQGTSRPARTRRGHRQMPRDHGSIPAGRARRDAHGTRRAITMSSPSSSPVGRSSFACGTARTSSSRARCSGTGWCASTRLLGRAGYESLVVVDVVTDVEVALERAKVALVGRPTDWRPGRRFTPSRPSGTSTTVPTEVRAAPTTPDSSSKRPVFWAWKPPCRSSRPTFHRRLTTRGSPPRYPATTLVTVG